jgi:hypothetical protein
MSGRYRARCSWLTTETVGDVAGALEGHGIDVEKEMRPEAPRTPSRPRSRRWKRFEDVSLQSPRRPPAACALCVMPW